MSLSVLVIPTLSLIDGSPDPCVNAVNGELRSRPGPDYSVMAEWLRSSRNRCGQRVYTERHDRSVL